MDSVCCSDHEGKDRHQDGEDVESDTCSEECPHAPQDSGSDTRHGRESERYSSEEQADDREKNEGEHWRVEKVVCKHHLHNLGPNEGDPRCCELQAFLQRSAE